MRLPFISYDDNGLITSLWAPERTGCYMKDCARGREYADALIDYMRQGENATIFAWIVRGFPDQMSGIEIGFCHRIAEHTLAP